MKDTNFNPFGIKFAFNNNFKAFGGASCLLGPLFKINFTFRIFDF